MNVRSIGRIWILLFAFSLMSETAKGQEPTRQGTAQANDPKEAAVRSSAQKYVEAFNRHDAAAVVNFWSENAVYVDEDGRRVEGRDAIAKEYAELFHVRPDVRIAVDIDSVRTVGQDTAIEEGRAALVPQPVGEPRVMSRYTAVHVQRDGKWLIADLRESRLELPPDYGNVSDLEWLVGEWKGASPSGKIDVVYRWLGKNRYLVREHRAILADGKQVTGMEVIGILPGSQHITSWVFSDDGSHSVGNWVPTDTGWQTEYQGAISEGTPTFALNSIDRKDDTTIVWKSEQRRVGDAILSDTPGIELRRR